MGCCGNTKTKKSCMCFPYDDPLIIIAKITAIIATIFSFAWWVTFFISLIGMIFFQLLWCRRSASMYPPVAVAIISSVTSLGVGIYITICDPDPNADDDWFADCPENDLGGFAFACSFLWAVTVICAVYFVMSGRHSKCERKHSGDIVAAKATTDSNTPAVKKRHLPPQDISFWSIMSPEPSEGGEADEFEDAETGCESDSDSDSSVEEDKSKELVGGTDGAVPPSQAEKADELEDVEAGCDSDSDSSIEEDKSEELVGGTGGAVPPSQTEETDKLDDVEAGCDSDSSIDEDKSEELVGGTDRAAPPSQGEEADKFEDIDE